MTEDCYFVRVDERRFLPQPTCAGAWNPAELHIAPVNGLLMHELERWVAGSLDDGKAITRISLDYLGVIDFRECELAFEVVRPGRAVELVEGVLSQGGRPVLRARVWRIADGDTAAVEGGLLDPLPPVAQAAPLDLTEVWPGGYIESIDARVLLGPTPGHTVAWMTTPLDIVESEPVTDLSRFVLLVDTTNGIAVRMPPEQWQFPNLDLTIHLLRQPVGRWAGFDTTVAFGASGHGLTSTALYDEIGYLGRAEQALIVRPPLRPGTPWLGAY